MLAIEWDMQKMEAAYITSMKYLFSLLFALKLGANPLIIIADKYSPPLNDMKINRAWMIALDKLLKLIRVPVNTSTEHKLTRGKA